MQLDQEHIVVEDWFFRDPANSLTGWYIATTIHTPNGLGGFLTRTVSIKWNHPKNKTYSGSESG